MTGTPFTQEFGFAAHHIPAFTPGGGLDPVEEPEPDAAAGEDDALADPVWVAVPIITGVPAGVSACHIPPIP